MNTELDRSFPAGKNVVFLTERIVFRLRDLKESILGKERSNLRVGKSVSESWRRVAFSKARPIATEWNPLLLKQALPPRGSFCTRSVLPATVIQTVALNARVG